MILVVTNKADAHSDSVIRVLSRSVPVFRINTEDLLSRYEMDLSLDPRGACRGGIRDEIGRQLEWSEIKVAWLRKPTFALTGATRQLPEEAAQFVVSEAKSLVDVMYAMPWITWINDPFAAHRAQVKYPQLLAAKAMGIDVPRTLLTTSPTAARNFARTCRNSILVKAVYTSNVTIGGINQGILSRRLSLKEFDAHADAIALCPTMLQEYVRKKFELRITVIGSIVTAVRIDSQEQAETCTDWRANTSLCKHSVFRLPHAIETFCRCFVKQQGLRFAALDFVVDPRGRFVFLESNPFANYAWQDQMAGVALSSVMADYLLDIDRRSPAPRFMNRHPLRCVARRTAR